MTYILILSSYLVGGLPFGLWLGLLFRHTDLREAGSGNIGATNAWRVLGWQVGLPAFILDLAKGLIPVIFARHFGPAWIHFGPSHLDRDALVVGCGLAAIVGHNVSPFLRFHGGKGVATSFGVALAMSPMAGLAGIVAWAVFLAITRTISIASLIGTPVGAFGIWFFNGESAPFGLFAILATLFVFVKHKSNIKRLAAGTEPRINPLLPAVKRWISRAGHSRSAT
jgi:glycerol-3-phosphate acyltransferase PlsY